MHLSQTYFEWLAALSAQLTAYSQAEAENLVFWLFEHHFGLRRADLQQTIPSATDREPLLADFERLLRGEPIQYILEEAPFYGRSFSVTRDTLIPRNETEELVHLILKENPKAGLRVLDLGTGTGCIPITLALELKEPKVYALDVSVKALDIARKNVAQLGAQVQFLEGDLLGTVPNLALFDILVSNPPYVPLRDQGEMHANVLDFEPHLALFVPDEDQLLFYRAIGVWGQQLLKKGGKLYLEIYENLAEELVKLLLSQGYEQLHVQQDLNGKNRMLSAIWP
ncbi:MAG: peptide chain release factor N(5)-glutamine methyltransferase [Bacteroidetes bacterium]|nr:peptide chain release factor N(5)-glutamine methyltransferase [Bacteroidota bacterium]